jgi:serine/threonine protein kinase
MLKQLEVGSRLREYDILETIGKGGMGSVYRAKHIYLEEERAIKVIHSRHANNKAIVDRFIREGRILTKLKHPNLVQLFELGTLDEDVFFISMEFIQGESVLDRIHRLGRIRIPDALRIAKEVAKGLHSVHEKGIVHRDMSPDNILIVTDEQENETVKIIDFGIAKPLFECTHGYTLANDFTGKVEYCSPEQCGLLEEDEVIDRRADIYSLGVTLYEMLTGRLPFYACTPQGYILKHANESPKPVSTHFLPGEFPEFLDKVITRMLMKKREERYSSMEGVIHDLNLIDSCPDLIPIKEMKDSNSLQIGDLFARQYLLQKKIGIGGMGVVYKAIDTFLQTPVALKILDSRVVQNEHTLERFKREVILTRKVAHPNACRMFECGEYKGIHYVTMEFLEGQTLREILDVNERLTPEVGLPIMHQVLLALQEVHRSGVIHRDLKPENIMVGSDQKAYVMDFGISISEQTERLTQAGVRIGTPEYMSPEQFEGKTIDQRSDIYAIGVVFHEMLTGKLPKSGIKPREIVRDFSAELESLILKCFERDPENRFQSVNELLTALHPLVRSSTSVVRTKSRNRRSMMLIVASLVLIALVFVIAKMNQKSEPLPISQIVPTPISVSINALPWAHVTIQAYSKDTKLPIFKTEDMITPLSVMIPPGKYKLEFKNNGISKPFSQDIIVATNKSNSFLFSLPDYNAEEIGTKMAAKQ